MKQLKSLSTLAAVLLAVLFLSACGSPKATLEATKTNPAALGEVRLEDKDDNGNNVIQIDVDSLSAPSKIDDSLTVYVVWIKPEGGDAYQNFGRLKIDDEQRGKISFTTPHKSFDVLVTAEEKVDVKTPSNYIVLQGTLKG